MTIKATTPITKLASKTGLTPLSIKICHDNGIITLADLFETSDQEILDFEKTRPASIQRIITAKKRLKDFSKNSAYYNGPNLFNYDNPELAPGKVTNTNILTNIFDNLKDKTDNPGTGLITEVFVSPNTFAKLLVNEPHFLAERINKDPFNAETLYEIYQTIVEQWLRHDLSTRTRQHILNSDMIVRDISERYRKINCYYKLSEPTRVKLDSEYRYYFSQLSRRTQNILKFIPSITDLLRYIYEIDSINYMSLTNCGKKSESEIKNFLNLIHQVYEQTVKHASEMTPSQANTADLEFQTFNLIEKYDWLTHDQARRAAKAQLAGKPLGDLFLIETYLLSAPTKDTIIFTKHIGFPPESEHETLDAIATQLKISRERVRQIFTKGITLPQSLYHIAEQLDTLFTEPLYNNQSPVWKAILQKYNYTGNIIDCRRLMALTAALLPRYELIYFNEKSPIFLILRSITSHIKLFSAIREIERRVACRRVKPQEIDISPIIDSRLDGNTSPEERMVLLDMIQQHITANGNSRVISRGVIESRATKFDIFEAIVSILKENGHPMKFDQLFSTYCQMYPNTKHLTSNAFRSYLQRSPNIVAIGKTGQYILDTWEGHFTGTITDYMYSLLEKSPEPLPFNTLLESTIQQFSRSSANSCFSILAYHGREKFTQYDNNYFGIKGRDYGPLWRPKALDGNIKHSFDSRMTQLEDFIATNQRFPLSSGDDEETSLLRWKRNVEAGRITPENAEQASRFKSCIDNNNNLIQNLDEKRYAMMCQRTIDYVTLNRHLPKSTYDVNLYSWFRKQRLTLDSLSGNYRRMADSMFQTIESLLAQ